MSVFLIATSFITTLLIPEKEFEAGGDRTYLAKADAMCGRIAATYFKGSPPGLWIDRFDLSGNVAVDHVPASILYHLLAPVVEYLRLEPRLP